MIHGTEKDLLIGPPLGAISLRYNTIVKMYMIFTVPFSAAQDSVMEILQLMGEAQLRDIPLSISLQQNPTDKSLQLLFLCHHFFKMTLMRAVFLQIIMNRIRNIRLAPVANPLVLVLFVAKQHSETS